MQLTRGWIAPLCHDSTDPDRTHRRPDRRGGRRHDRPRIHPAREEPAQLQERIGCLAINPRQGPEIRAPTISIGTGLMDVSRSGTPTLVAHRM